MNASDTQPFDSQPTIHTADGDRGEMMNHSRDHLSGESGPLIDPNQPPPLFLTVTSTSAAACSDNLVAHRLPLPIIPPSEITFLHDGPYERVIIPPLMNIHADGVVSLSPILYGRYANRLIVLMKLHAGPQLCPILLQQFEARIKLIHPTVEDGASEHVESFDPDRRVVRVCGRCHWKGAHFILMEWLEENPIHHYLRLYGPTQAHRIQRIKRTQQLMQDVKQLYESRTKREPNPFESSPRISVPSPHAVLNIPPDELVWEKDPRTNQRKMLGHGSFATVYLARYQGQYVAVKLLHQQLSVDGIAEIEKEVEVMRETESPYIIQITGTCKKDGEYLIVMEYMFHGDLFHYLQEHDQITWAQRIKWMRQLASGMKILHQQHIAHRDSKSLNCLLDANLNLKICDFGLSTLRCEGNSTSGDAPKHQAMGTAKWMAPENFPPKTGVFKRLFSRRQSVSYLATDVWSFGWVLIEILTGRIPFCKIQSETEVIALLRTITQPILKSHIPPFPSSTPTDLCDLIHSCLNVDPTLRPTMDRVCDDLHRINPESFESLEQFRRLQDTMSAMLESIESFNQVRVMIGYYTLFMTDEETREFEQDLLICRTIRTYLDLQNGRACAEQPTIVDHMQHLSPLSFSSIYAGHSNNASDNNSPRTRRSSIDQGLLSPLSSTVGTLPGVTGAGTSTLMSHGTTGGTSIYHHTPQPYYDHSSTAPLIPTSNDHAAVASMTLTIPIQTEEEKSNTLTPTSTSSNHHPHLHSHQPSNSTSSTASTEAAGEQKSIKSEFNFTFDASDRKLTSYSSHPTPSTFNRFHSTMVSPSHLHKYEQQLRAKKLNQQQPHVDNNTTTTHDQTPA